MAGFKISPSTLHLVVRTACLLLPVVYLVHVIRTDKIVDECSTDYIYLPTLSHNIRNKKCLQNIFLKHVLIRSVVSASARDYLAKYKIMNVQSPNFTTKLYCYESVMTSCQEGLLHLTKVADSFGQAASHWFHTTPLSFFL